MVAFLAPLAALAMALAAAGYICNNLRISPALGYLAVGVIASPYALGGDYVDEATVHKLSEVGVLVVLFLIGLELDLKTLRSALRATAATMPFDLLVPIVLITTIGRMSGMPFSHALTLGLICCVSSTLFGERLSSQPGVSRTTHKRVVGVLISEDVAAAGLLATIVVIAGGSTATGPAWAGPIQAFGWLAFLLILLTTGALLLVPRLLDLVARTHAHELLVLAAAALVVLFGYVGTLAGSAELGALIAGVAAAEAGSRFVVRSSISGLRDLALAVFFLAAGMGVDPAQIMQHPGLVLAVAGAFLASKLTVHVASAAAAGHNLRNAMYTGFSLGVMGEFSLILLAAAELNGLATPVSRSIVVGAMVSLLAVSPFMMKAVPSVDRAFHRTPARYRRPIVWVFQGMRSRPRAQEASPRRRVLLRLIAANVLLMTGWALVVIWLAGRLPERLPTVRPFLLNVGVYGIGAAVALPLLVAAYRHYRSLVWLFVGRQEGERQGAGLARARVVDAILSVLFVLLLVPVAIGTPATLPALAGAVIVAATIGILAWRHLSEFHRTLEGTITRVLGHDEEAAVLLDRAMHHYPWGVRFAAVAVPGESALANQTLEGSRISELTGAVVAVVQRRREEIVNPPRTLRIQVRDTLILMGDQHQLEKAEALLVSHGTAIRMTAQSRAAGIHELTVSASSPWRGKRLVEAAIKEETGTLVVGVCKPGRAPQAYDAAFVLEPGDRLIVLGGPLQVDRARMLASGIESAPPLPPPPAGSPDAPVH